MFNHYFYKLKNLLDLVETTEKEKIKAAATKLAASIQHNGIIHVFGCGHSHMIGEELFYRAGGLAPISPILIEDLMLHKGAVRSSKLEKMNDYAEDFMRNVTILPEDVVIVISTSGKNPVPIDVAKIAKQQGAFVIAITSHLYAQNQPSRHKNGDSLADVADLSIDNHIEIGDALITSDESNASFGSGSTIVNMSIANGIIVETVQMLHENNIHPPIFKSGNIAGSEEHNRQIINTYKTRIPMLEE
ncbi:SIS domain-containing protein [Bacillus sp. B15-48]|uniref:SIS domain-containing protein n=1 Tax=Bacillus sp. B15-48 TaxID=1548601 RepID=UPI00193FC43E|nr:SIS domain-containing protein [Bacillus sp. B15-48]MBM4761400.1 sugar isomerase domain-containing protein [Bacillus sp. B15-48]